MQCALRINLTGLEQSGSPQQFHANCTLLTANRPVTLSGNIKQPPRKPRSDSLLWSWVKTQHVAVQQQRRVRDESVPKPKHQGATLDPALKL